MDNKQPTFQTDNPPHTRRASDARNGRPEESNPKVCVGILTFNQAEYIRQALDSVIAQQTNFEFTIVVHDDCSTDGTREIVAEYAAAHPSRIRAILQDKNQFSQGRRVVLILLAAMAGEGRLDGASDGEADRAAEAAAGALLSHGRVPFA